MSLSNAYMVGTGRMPDLFAKIRDGQAPQQVTQQLLKDWGFSSSNDRAFIPVLKSLGFLSPDGKPTSLYHEYRDHSRSKAVMAQALRQAYGDIFLIKEYPADADKNVIEGKFKSFHNTSDNVASLMTKTFYALLSLSDLKALSQGSAGKKKVAEEDARPEGPSGKEHQEKPQIQIPSLHYNIQIHLPATKDVEVYSAIFKSLKEHFLEE